MALLLGCKKNDAAIEPSVETPVQEEVVTEQPAEQEEQPTEETVAEEPQDNTRAIKITFVNQTGVDIGMLSVIEPTTGEQVQVDPIPADESLDLEAAWPNDVDTFHWALYNADGDLYMESETDITVAQSEATITLVGDGEVSEIQEEYK